MKTAPPKGRARAVSGTPPRGRQTIRVDLPDPIPEWAFTFIYRLGVAVIAVAFAMLPLGVWGWLHGWVLGRGAVITEGVIVSLIVSTGEFIRGRVYSEHRTSHEAANRREAVERLLRMVRAEAVTRVTTVGSAAGESRTKRAVDVLISGTLLFLLGPVLASIALLIRLDSPGPALAEVDALGLHGHRIRLLRFRTSHYDPRFPAEALPRNLRQKYVPKPTRVGELLRETSLDQLPLLWNVFRGDLSLVGPLPLSQPDVEEIGTEIFDRLAARPGFISPALLARDDPSTDAIALENQYAQYWSFRFDMRLMVRAFAFSLRGFVSERRG